jgi:hypothetical protein
MNIQDPKEISDADRRILFDWYNHVTTSSLIIIGGIIGFLPKGAIPTYALIALALVVVGATVALGASARFRPGTKPAAPWSIGPYLERHAHGFVAAGAGCFIGGISKLIF